MNLIYNCAKFAASPVVDLWNLATAKKQIQEENQVMAASQKILEGITQPLKTDVELALKHEITKLGYDSSKVIMRISDRWALGTMGHVGSIKNMGHCYLWVGSKMAEELEKGLTDKHQFLLAHEMAHDDIETASDYQTTKLKSSSEFRLKAYGISACAIGLLFGAGLMVSHLSGLVISKLLARQHEYKLSRKLEKECDLKAVTGRPELAKAAIRYFSKTLEGNKQLKATNPSLASKVDNNGNNIFDLEHPPLTERIAYLLPYANG